MIENLKKTNKLKLFKIIQLYVYLKVYYFKLNLFIVEPIKNKPLYITLWIKTKLFNIQSN